MIKATFIFIVSIVCGVAHGTPVACAPSELGGTGTSIVTGSNPQGRWAAYWCGSDLHLFACRSSACPTISQLAAQLERLRQYPNLGTLNDWTAGMTLGPNDLRDVWLPDIAKINAIKPK